MMGMVQKIDTATGARLAASALDWWREAGVDTLIDEQPRNWLAPPPPSTNAAMPAFAPAPVAVPALAALPPVLLPATLAAFEPWRLSDAAPDGSWPGVRIGAEGKASSALMVMIEMPERDDTPSALLSGPAGIVFDRMLAAIGLDRASIYLAPFCVVRPLSGRLSAADEAALAPAARKQVQLAAPQCLLVIGNAPSRAIIGTDVAAARGILHSINHEARETGGQKGAHPATRAVASFSPRFLLERPAAKAEAWKDLQLVMKGLM